MPPLITLTTDFGADSGYVAQMKGVLLSISRNVDIVDISHAVRPQDVRQGAILLADVTPRFPPGSLHIAVVDPGVGTSRRILYADFGLQRYLAPDNGLLSYLAAGAQPRVLISVENPSYWLPGPSNTFHGRDIMAPVAAYLTTGVNPRALGPPAESMVSLSWPLPERNGNRIVGEVLLADSFGNLITNISRDALEELSSANGVTVEIAGYPIHGIHPTYGARANGELVALFDSQGRLEIAQVGGNAAAKLAVAAGATVTVT